MNIAVFASGEGTNAEAIIRHFNTPGSPHEVSLVVVDRPTAGAARRADSLGVAVAMVPRSRLAEPGALLSVLASRGIGFIALAGFLSMIPSEIVEAYRGRIVNIHPSLLPRHGGRGMYGRRVHEAVLAAGDTETGITIHHVDEHYDTGHIIFQARVPVLPADTAADIEARVRSIEPAHYPAVIASLLS